MTETPIITGDSFFYADKFHGHYRVMQQFRGMVQAVVVDFLPSAQIANDMAQARNLGLPRNLVSLT